MEVFRVGAEADKTTVNRERADRRRAVARTVRDLRDRLTSDTGSRPIFDYELTLAFTRNRLSSSLALFVLMGLVGFTASLWLGWKGVVSWLALLMATHLLTTIHCRQFGAQQHSEVNNRTWRQRFVVLELACGIAWAIGLVLTAGATGTGIEVFQFAMTLTVIAAYTTVAAPLPGAAFAATIPMPAILILILAGRGGLLYTALAIVIAGAESFFLILASRLHGATLSMLQSRAEKDLLIAELETAKAISDEARRRAEEANLAKSRFLATMSHELRTPLNAILGFSEVMMNGVLGPMENASYKEYVGDIHASGKHLLNLINEILDLSRIEAGRYELNEEAVSLAQLSDECYHLVLIKARNKNITIVQQVERDMPRLWADERAVRQIILNLLANAVKFTQSGGQVTVRVGWTSGGGQYVSVRDNGPGIPEEEIPIVLSTFGQGSIAIKSAEQGTGLGLPIVQALVHTHDGTFELRSKLREGTEAIATFPRSRVMQALPPIKDRNAQGGRLRQVS
jgi:two-component system cell cycle sensor histidine kinase PleC